MPNSLFTKIINGEIPCQKIHETDNVLAFLDIRPINAGHTLIVPKVEVDHLWELDDDIYAEVMLVTKQVASRIREVLQPVRVGMLLEGFQVPHAHVHAYPLYDAMESTFLDYFDRNKRDDFPSSDELDAMAKKLAF